MHKNFILQCVAYQNKYRKIARLSTARKDYEEITALIGEQFNESVDLLHEDMGSRISALRSQRDEKLVAALSSFIKIITPYLNDSDLSILMELGIILSNVDVS
jgi:hypothetical protein